MEVEILKRLALMGAARENVNLSSTRLGSTIGMSSQTAARRLVHLEKQGYIQRTVTTEGQDVRLTDRGLSKLRSEFLDYKKIFEDVHEQRFKGRVTTGLGEGQYYISLDGYRMQFKEKLGFEPYPGTLNLQLKEPFAQHESSAIQIGGFKDASRTFGGGKCYPVRVGGVRAAIIRPDRSSYPLNLVEIIAPVNLRKTLGLKDGDEVEVTLE
jgi:riboflavin kinase, archaea type